MIRLMHSSSRRRFLVSSPCYRIHANVPVERSSSPDPSCQKIPNASSQSCSSSSSQWRLVSQAGTRSAAPACQSATGNPAGAARILWPMQHQATHDPTGLSSRRPASPPLRDAYRSIPLSIPGYRFGTCCIKNAVRCRYCVICSPNLALL